MSHTHETRCRFDGSYWMFLLAGALATASIFPPAIIAQTATSVSAPKTHPDSAWLLSTSHFNNSFEAEPYVGNGYIGLRIPAAGMGFLGDLGKVGWPIGT